MSLPALNLLRHPRRLPQMHSPQLSWAAVGLLAGMLAAAGWRWWCEVQQPSWLQQSQELRARLARQAHEQTAAAALAKQQRLTQQLEQRRQEWQSAVQQQRGLHALLTELAVDSGLRLQRWQGDGQRMQLQGWLPDAQALASLQNRLSQSGTHTWTWQSLVSEPGGGVQWVLEASAPHRMQSTESRRP